MRRVGLAAAAFVFAGIAVAQDVPELKPAGARPDVVDVVVLGMTRPIRVRLQLALDNRSLTQTWRNHVKRWFDYLDRDNDGALSEGELLLAPAPAAMLQSMRQGNIVFASGLGIPGANFGDSHSASLSQFEQHYRANGAGPISVTRGQSAPADNVSERLFNRLDRNADGKISRDELAAAPDVLRQLDANDDELFTVAELLGNDLFGNPYGNGLGDQNEGGKRTKRLQPGVDAPLVLDHRETIYELFRRLDRNEDSMLSRDESGLTEDLFARLDKNRNGKLEVLELRGWTNLPPDVEWSASWPGLSKDAMAMPSMAATAPAARDVAPLMADDVSIRFHVAPRQQFPRGGSPMQYLMQNFKAADSAGAGFLTRDQLKQQQLLLQMFALLDRDGDGKLVEREVQEFVDMQRDALSCHVTLALADQGRGLFTVLDANRDGFLSGRELRTGWKRLAPPGADESDGVRLEQVFRQCTLSVAVGYGAPAVQPFAQNQAAAARYPSGTPTWFVKMDANGDGEVSRREFLGPASDFRRLDLDGDGVISPDEAIQDGRRK